jgi:Anti-sigma-K factor rskA
VINMNSPNSADEWSELLAGYVLGDLTTAEIAAVEEYLAGSEAAQQELQQLQIALSFLAVTNPVIDTAPATVTEIASLARLREQIVSPVSLPIAQPRKTRILSGIGWGLGAIATILAATLGWQNYQLNQQLTVAQQKIQNQQNLLSQSGQQLTATQQELQSQQAILRQSGNKLLAIKGMDGGGKSTGSLVMSPAMDTAVLVLQKVPALPPGKVYRMWAMIGHDEMACADFVPDQAGQVFQKVSLKDWQTAKTVVVTIEPVKESPIPEGTAVMMGGEEIDL